MNERMENKNITIIDDVNGGTVSFHNAIVSAVKNGGILPYELSDLFSLRVEVEGDKVKAFVNWA